MAKDQNQNGKENPLNQETPTDTKSDLEAAKIEIVAEEQIAADCNVQKLEKRVDSRVRLQQESNEINLQAFDIEKGLTQENQKLVDFVASYYESMLYYSYIDSENRARKYKAWEDKGFLSKFYNQPSSNSIGELSIETKTLDLIEILENTEAKFGDRLDSPLIDYWKKKKQEIHDNMECIDMASKYSSSIIKDKIEQLPVNTLGLSSKKQEIIDSVKNIINDHPYIAISIGIVSAIAGVKLLTRLFDAINPKGIFSSLQAKILASLGIAASVPLAVEGIGKVLNLETARKIVKTFANAANIEVPDHFIMEVAQVLEDPKLATEEKISKVLKIIKKGENPNRELHLAAISDIKAKTGKDIHESTLHLCGNRPFKDFASPERKKYGVMDFGRKIEREFVSKIPFGEFMEAWISNPDLPNDQEILRNEYFPKILADLESKSIKISEDATVNDILALATGKANESKESEAMDKEKEGQASELAEKAAEGAVVAGVGIDSISTSKEGLSEFIRLVKENKWEKTSDVLQEIGSHERIASYLWEGLGTDKNPSKDLIKALILDGATLVAKEGVVAIWYGGKIFFLSTWEPLYDTFLGFMNPKPGEDRLDCVLDYTFAQGTVIMMGVHTALNLADKQNVIKAFASGIAKGIAAPIANAHTMTKWAYRGAVRTGDAISDSFSAAKVRLLVPEGDINARTKAMLSHVEHYFNQWQKYQNMLNMKKDGYSEAYKIAQRGGSSTVSNALSGTAGKLFYSEEVLHGKVVNYGRSFYEMVDELSRLCGESSLKNIDALDETTRMTAAIDKLNELKPKLNSMNIDISEVFQKKLGIANIENSKHLNPDSPDKVWNDWIKEKAKKMGYDIDLAKYPKLTGMAKIMVKFFGPTLSILTILRLYNAPDKRAAVLEEAASFGGALLAVEGVTVATGNPLYGAGAAIFVGLASAFGFSQMSDEIKKKISDAIFPSGGHSIASEMGDTMIHYQAMMLKRRFIGKKFAMKVGQKLAAAASKAASKGVVERLIAKGGIKGGIAAAETFMVANDVAGPVGWLDMPLEILFGGLLAYDAYDIYKSIDNAMKVSKYFETNGSLAFDQILILDSKGEDISSSSIFENHIKTNYPEYASVIGQFDSDKEARDSMFKLLLQDIMHDEAKITALLHDFPKATIEATRDNSDIKMKEVYNYEVGKLTSVTLFNPDRTEYAKFESSDGSDLMYGDSPKEGESEEKQAA